MYYQAARQILDRALVDGPQPASIKWHFDPRDNQEGMDRVRVKRDGQSILLNNGANPIENGLTVVHHDSWDKAIGFRGFTVPTEGEYIIRFRAAGRVPGRDEVVASAEKILKQRYDEAMAANPAGKVYHVSRDSIVSAPINRALLRRSNRRSPRCLTHQTSCFLLSRYGLRAVPRN